MAKCIRAVLILACVILASCDLFQPAGLKIPTDLTATAVSASRVDLAWTDASSGESGFLIGRKTAGAGDFSQIAETGTDVTAYVDVDVDAQTAYTYRVRSYNASGNSSYSHEVSTTTPAAGSGAERERGTSPLYFAYNDGSSLLWWVPSDPSSSVYQARVAITDAGGTQQSGTAISVDYDATGSVLYFAYADASGNLWYVPHDPASTTNLARVAICDAGGTQQSGTAVSVVWDSAGSMLYFAYADASGNLWYVPHDPASTTNLARVAITDAGGTQQTGTAISVDYDSVEGVLYFAYADASGSLWYVPHDPDSSVDYARVAITDAGGTQQTGSAISVDHDSSTLLLWFAYADASGSLWYVPHDPDSSVDYARVAITDAGSTQQTGSAVALDYDPGEKLLWVAYADALSSLWFVPMDPASGTPRARAAITDAAGTQQTGTKVAISF